MVVMRTHSTRCGEAVTATKEEKLFWSTINLGILNVGCMPTFRNSVKKEFLDISLASKRMESRIRSWRVDRTKTTAVSVVSQKAMARSGGLESSLLSERRSEDFTISLTD